MTSRVKYLLEFKQTLSKTFSFQTCDRSGIKKCTEENDHSLKVCKSPFFMLGDVILGGEKSTSLTKLGEAHQ